MTQDPFTRCQHPREAVNATQRDLAGPLHPREAAPLQWAPPGSGAGLVQVRVCEPPEPQVTEQALHADQPPLMAQ